VIYKALLFKNKNRNSNSKCIINHTETSNRPIDRLLSSAVANEDDNDHNFCNRIQNVDKSYYDYFFHGEFGEGMIPDLTSPKKDDDSISKFPMPWRGGGVEGVGTNSGNNKNKTSRRTSFSSRNSRGSLTGGRQ